MIETAREKKTESSSSSTSVDFSSFVSSRKSVFQQMAQLLPSDALEFLTFKFNRSFVELISGQTSSQKLGGKHHPTTTEKLAEEHVENNYHHDDDDHEEEDQNEGADDNPCFADDDASFADRDTVEIMGGEGVVASTMDAKNVLLQLDVRDSRSGSRKRGRAKKSFSELISGNANDELPTADLDHHHLHHDEDVFTSPFSFSSSSKRLSIDGFKRKFRFLDGRSFPAQSAIDSLSHAIGFAQRTTEEALKNPIAFYANASWTSASSGCFINTNDDESDDSDDEFGFGGQDDDAPGMDDEQNNNNDDDDDDEMMKAPRDALFNRLMKKNESGGDAVTISSQEHNKKKEFRQVLRQKKSKVEIGRVLFASSPGALKALVPS